jgi:hypothetical protein
MSTNNTYECTELTNMSRGLYNTDSKMQGCSELSALNTIINNQPITAVSASSSGGSGGSSGGSSGISRCPELSNFIKNSNSNTNDNLNIFNSNLKIMNYSGSPIYILLLIAIIANIFLAIPLMPVFIAGFFCIIILILILAMLCIYLIHMLLFQE